MKYVVSTRNNADFLQILGFTQTHQVEAPIAFQARGGGVLLSRLIDLLEEGLARIKQIDADFHQDPDAERAFHEGFVLFKPGAPPLTLIGCQRFLTLVVGNRAVGSGPLNDAPALLKALKTERVATCKN